MIVAIGMQARSVSRFRSRRFAIFLAGILFLLGCKLPAAVGQFLPTPVALASPSAALVETQATQLSPIATVEPPLVLSMTPVASEPAQATIYPGPDTTSEAGLETVYPAPEGYPAGATPGAGGETPVYPGPASAFSGGQYPVPAGAYPGAYPAPAGAYPGVYPAPAVVTTQAISTTPAATATSTQPATTTQAAGQMPAPNVTSTQFQATPTPTPTASSTISVATATSTPTTTWTPTPTATPSLTPTPSPTPFYTSTPTATPTPTITPTPLPPPPWVSAQMHATDPSTVLLASGKVQLVEFFAYWNGPSLAMAPVVQQIEQEYRGKANFVYLDVDDPATKDFQRQLGFRIEPQFFLLDAQGRVLRQWVGYVTLDQFRQALNAALYP